MDVVCSNCGTENPAGRKFCGNCRQTLAVVCSVCGTPNEARFKFCGECGSPLGDAASAILAQPSGTIPAVERRLVSVLFADLVGFTALSESRDPDEVRDLLSRYFDACRQLIARYGGTVEKFIGDAVMAVWGTPVAQEDDAERAVRAALDLTRAVAALGEETGAELQARAAVLTGEAAVALNAEGQGMVAGDLVNTASRVQAIAPPGAVYVGEATRRATEEAIAYEDAGAHDLKGKAEQVRVHRALRVVGGKGGALKSRGLEAPFVGRDRELRLVKELFHASAEDRRAHLLQVTGIAGIGKSRLSWEFYKYIDGLLETIHWHRGRCLAYGDGVTYWALAEMVRFRARIAEGEALQEALAKLRTAVEEYMPDPEERQRVEPRLAHLLGLEQHTAREPEDLFSAWRLFFERLAERNPTVLVFEDMQWADPSLLDFVDYLMTWSRNHPLFVTVLARPEFTERHPDWAAGKRGVTQLYLEPLSPPQMDELLTGLVPGLPEDVKGRIKDRAEGVPLYAVETVRMLLDRGLLVREGPVYRLTGSVEAMEVPETLHALIAARLDNLPAEERSLLQDAAVLGKTFSRSALAVITGRPETDMDPLLASLTRKEVLTVQADPRSPERGQYGFLQDLVRRVAYETLSKRDRKARHMAAAAHLESSWGGEDVEIVEIVASHYLEAYRAAPDAPDAAEVKARARNALVLAGDRSRSLAAAASALRYYEQAIELADDPVLQAELHDRAGAAAFAAARVDVARPHLDAAVAGFREAGDLRGAAGALSRLGNLAFGNGRLEEAIALLEEAYDVLSKEAPDATLARVASELGRLLHFRGRTEEAVPKLEQALELAETLELPDVFSHTLNTKGITMFRTGRREEGMLLVRHSLDVALRNELREAALRANNNLASLLDGADRYREMFDLVERALELARRYGDRGWEFKSLASSVGAMVVLGRWDEALARNDEVEAAEDVTSYQGITIELMPRTFVYVHRGDLEAARHDLERFADVGGSEEMQARSAYAFFRAFVLRVEGRPDEALKEARRGMELGETAGTDHGIFKYSWVEAVEAALDMSDLATARELLAMIDGFRPGMLTPLLRAERARLGARVSTTAGEHDGVEAGFEAAAREFRDIELPFHLARTLLEHAEWLAEQSRRADAEPLMAEARDVFERLRAAPWLERLAALQQVDAPTGAAPSAGA